MTTFHARSVAGFHRSFIPQRLVQRRKPLLAIQQVFGRLTGTIGIHSLDQTASKPQIPTGIERHHGADGEAARYADQQILDSVIVPNPATLEVWKLDFAVLNIFEKTLQQERVSFERRHYSSFLHGAGAILCGYGERSYSIGMDSAIASCVASLHPPRSGRRIGDVQRTGCRLAIRDTAYGVVPVVRQRVLVGRLGLPRSTGSKSAFFAAFPVHLPAEMRQRCICRNPRGAFLPMSSSGVDATPGIRRRFGLTRGSGAALGPGRVAPAHRPSLDDRQVLGGGGMGESGVQGGERRSMSSRQLQDRRRCRSIGDRTAREPPRHRGPAPRRSSTGSRRNARRRSLSPRAASRCVPRDARRCGPATIGNPWASPASRVGSAARSSSSQLPGRRRQSGGTCASHHCGQRHVGR